ncbi:carcinine transporter [Orussus abietinus]|uniref:carcinine transporter n=1 Tax=Orussus abietinus TaxID=222816 RepID=UPI000626E6B4|nr:carcinine transporter [Orussus abietinus]XP_012276485.1 carcinine transporter [Orussus abietinus]
MQDEELEQDEKTVLRISTFDSILTYVGDFGKYQWYLLLSLFPYTGVYVSLYFSQFFLTLVPREHWCRVPEVVDLNCTSEEQRILLAIPKADEYPYYDGCYQKDLNFSKLLREGHEFQSLVWSTNKTVPCSDWEFNYTQIPYRSIAAELGWVCNKAYLVSTAQAIFFCGSIIGGFFFGWLADHHGRILTLMVLNGIALIATIATAFASDFWSFAICRFFAGLAFDNCINIPLIVVVEYMAVNKRTLVFNMTFGLFFALLSTMLPWVAYFIADWRNFTYVSSIPILLCLLTPWIIPESARWYISKGRMEKVFEKLQKIATVNGRTFDPKIYGKFVKGLKESSHNAENATLLDLFRTPRLAKHAILLILFWFLTIATFDGHVYSLKLLPDSVFTSFSLACATELPAGVLLTLLLDRWGRRFCGFITMALTGVFSLVTLLLHSSALLLTMAILARFCLNMAANIALQYAAEVLPTPVRAQGVALIHIFGIFGHAIAPYIVDTALIWGGLPMLIMGILSSITGILVTFLPETLGMDLPQTLQEGEDFGKDQSFWALPCCTDNNL